MTDDWLAVRNAVFDKASANEFSVGSLVSFRQKDYDYESNTYIESHPVGLVEGISWGDINDGTINSRQKTVFVSYYSSDTTTGDRSLARRTKWIALPAEITKWAHIQRAGRLYAHTSKTKIIVATVAVSVSM